MAFSPKLCAPCPLSSSLTDSYDTKAQVSVNHKLKTNVIIGVCEFCDIPGFSWNVQMLRLLKMFWFTEYGICLDDDLWRRYPSITRLDRK